MSEAMAGGKSNALGWTIAFWVVQILLAAFFGMAGFAKVSQPIADLAASGMGFVTYTPEWLVRFIGIAELAGAVGIILPAATRILPFLTPLAAAGFGVIQTLAMGVHITHGEVGVLPINLVVLALSLFVAWGRWKKAPIAAR